MIGEVASKSGPLDPRSLYLLGVRADIEGEPKTALAYFERAVNLLQDERANLFDPRSRGTVIENRPEIVRDLALRLLAFKKMDEAFLAFESIRARGLGELASAYAENQFKEEERRSLAEVVQAESQESALLIDLVETSIAGVEYAKSVEIIEHLTRIRKRHRELLQQPAFNETVKKLVAAVHSSPTMSEIQDLVRKANIPVVMYWVTHTNVIVWVISPNGVEVKTVFLPEVAVIDKVAKLVRSITTNNQPFDEKSARELHTYLIKPFSKYLTQKQVLIVPQGPLVTLPFEALVDAETGSFLVESAAISYAPNVSFAARVLRAKLPPLSKVTAIYDENLERITGEVSRIAKNGALRFEMKPSQGLTAKDVGELLGGGNVHVLLHGIFDSKDPLQSRIRLNNPKLSSGDNEITAAELLAVDWRGTHLAVFSSCQGAMINTRISNEVYGLSWAPLVGGVDHVVLSRWRVQSNTNADWMEMFYKTLASGDASPALAAAAAMRGMIAHGRRHPFFWAGPQVFGR